MPRDSRCRVCSRGVYSCHWSQPSENKRRLPRFWFSVVVLISLLSLCWMYICLVTYNDSDEINSKAFEKLKQWVNWFIVLCIISAVFTSYCLLLLLLALFHVALREPLDLHCLHKIFLFLGVTLILFAVTGIRVGWPNEWPTVPLSLQATAPFLQLGAVGALTLLSWFVFRAFHRSRRAGSRILIAVLFVAVSAAIFLCPLLIRSPCLIESKELPPKPNLFGHRGAPMLAPENTLMSFERSMECNVTVFETDIQLSQDRVPFLMHDKDFGFLMRTTNVKDKFPDRDFRKSMNITWEELQRLNAGDWFLKTDPFRSVSQLTAEDRKTARNQSIPSLVQLLDFAKQHNISVMFDIYSDDQANDTVDIVNAIVKSDIAPSLILWLPPAEREYVNQTAPGFIHVYDNVRDMEKAGGSHLNVKYNNLSTAEIRELRRKNVSVNLWVVTERWLFSLLWCAGVSSVTTNSCHLLQRMDRPIWVLAPGIYRAIWITVDLISLLIMIVFFIIQREQKNRISDGNPTELILFLPSDSTSG
ncbi:glycerophosphoinositol inositolphosphodiesterase GDPD2 [Genypterus blacodes]|uniref:glycerophosphoinositol inositolphosphodiesterase GDPD2 n=1 Tax=Genypterus blacodes TaxID=154954 RepID=UPI003F775146